MKIFTCRIQVDTHDPRATEEKVKTRLAALQLSRCEASIRNARNIQNYYRRIGHFMFKVKFVLLKFVSLTRNRAFIFYVHIKDNLYNDRSLAALKQAIKEQMVLIRKTTLIGRSVIDKVISLNKELKVGPINCVS